MAKAEASSVYAFIDESGNSGLDLLDVQQPYFWTGALLTRVDLDAIAPEIRDATLRRAGIAELHGKELGPGGIEKIAGRIIYLVRKYHLDFYFTRIAKEIPRCHQVTTLAPNHGPV